MASWHFRCTPTRPLPPHGTEARYRSKRAPCRCIFCNAAAAQARANRRVVRALKDA